MPDPELQRRIMEVRYLCSSLVSSGGYRLGKWLKQGFVPTGGTKRAWGHPPGVPGSTKGHWGRCGLCHPEP